MRRFEILKDGAVVGRGVMWDDQWATVSYPAAVQPFNVQLFPHTRAHEENVRWIDAKHDDVLETGELPSERANDLLQRLIEERNPRGEYALVHCHLKALAKMLDERLGRAP